MSTKNFLSILFFTLTLPLSACNNASLSEATIFANKAQENWQLVLGSEGPQVVDKLIAQHTPSCSYFDNAEELETYSEELRAYVIDALALNFDQEPITFEIQNIITEVGYSIEVIRLEVLPEVYLPINVYIPDDVAINSAPLVISPTGCGSSTWSEHVQARAANFSLMGIVTIVTEGFCDNGSRAALADSNRNFGYARELMGLKGDVNFYLQELIGTINWALENYEEIDLDLIGMAGYSYGGQMSLNLAQVDTRIQSISIPATAIGNSCEDFELNSDIWIEDSEFWPDHLWSPPMETPILPNNSRVLLMSPRFFHTTSGEEDLGALSDFIAETISYMDELYGLSALSKKIFFKTDPGGHHYGQIRREDTYSWFQHSFFNLPLAFYPEIDIPLQLVENLRVDIDGTETLSEQLIEEIDEQLAIRFNENTPAPDYQETIENNFASLFPEKTLPSLTTTTIWEENIDNFIIRGRRFRNDHFDFPIFAFENSALDNNKTILFLPSSGTQQELEKIFNLLQDYQHVVSLDYTGIGELKSNRLLLHTSSRHFMNNDPSLFQINIDLIKSYLDTLNKTELDIYGENWSTSFYAIILKWLKPQLINQVLLNGVPENELSFLKSGEKIPDLLYWNSLYQYLSIQELSLKYSQEVLFIGPTTPTKPLNSPK